VKELASLSLENAKVTDAGLKELKELKNLTRLVLSNTAVTAEGAKQFTEALPKCKILGIVTVKTPGDPKKGEPTAD